jgi:hypothetical protein
MGFTLQMYTHMRPSSHDRARQQRTVGWTALLHGSRSKAHPGLGCEEPDKDPGLI